MDTTPGVEGKMLTIVFRGCLVAGILFSQLTFAGPPNAEGRTGTSRQALGAGEELVTEATQRQLGLVSLWSKSATDDNWGSCSGTLLVNDWVLTAAHCVSEGGESSGRIIDPPDRIHVTARFGSPAMQELEAIRIVKYLPFDVAVVQLSHPMVVNGARTGFSNLERLDTRGVYRTGETVRLYGRGLDSYSSIDEWGKVTYAGGDDLYRTAPAHIAALKYGRYILSNAAHTMGGDSGGASFRNDGSLVGVHSACQIACSDGSTSCARTHDWSLVSASSQCVDASVNPTQLRIKTELASRLMVDAPYMGVIRQGATVTYINPVIRSEYGTRTRLDKCKAFAKECGGEAAAAFCVAQDRGKPFVSGNPTIERTGLTAVIEGGTVCRGACDAYKSITCIAVNRTRERVGP